MGNVELKNYMNKLAEAYIHEHPFNMSILLQKNAQEDFEVLYANTLALQHFNGHQNQRAADFFGEVWTMIEQSLSHLHRKNHHATEIVLDKNGANSLFEISVQQSEEDGNFSIFVQMCERMDLLTEREKWQEFQQKYMSVINHNLDPIFLVNRKLEIIYANREVQNAFDYQLEELAGSKVLDIVDEGDVDYIKSCLSRALAGESIEVEGISFLHKRGIVVPTTVKAIPITVNGEVREVHLLLRDTTVHDEHTAKLLYLSYHDQLTGLWNRRAMKEHFAEDSSYALKSDERISFIHLGLDRFKLINESLGHSGADEVLKKIAERLKMSCPVSAKLYRNGGDEFVVSLRNHSVSKTEKFAQKLLNDFGKPFYYQHQEYFISASIGISVYPEDGKTLESLIRKSEQALAFVKDRGRSHYRFYQKEMNTTFPDEALMESHLRRAVELNELTVHYQPQVDLKTGQISSFEALLRWNNRKFGFVSPVQFIPIAEDSGLIHGIGDWVLEQVCIQLKEWQDKQFKPVRIAVNISPKQFQMESFSSNLRNKIANHGIVPSSLELEITESAMTNMNETLKTINELKRIGVYISVDDFGTGYSSLSYLKQYPIDIIKIDRSFIKDIEVDEKNKAIAKTIINLAHNLGMTVVAEGVEKDLQAQILLEANCQKAQGFLYSKAVPIEEIVEKYIE
ncbi:EAL domain-containing protein [Sporosarcina sp. ACRSM]|uniref:sensor domain-containing protein n=1 Tax=Sporosarcina sp. ACRSM TaxID=2918216 RepID=UPI001EF717F5|nr:EAL domain-containing protein [Sporosarcina sp. ACRSM]MCG7334236.1 EAL domain-containing protein [Sporosarcina sp. ACRSM]